MHGLDTMKYLNDQAIAHQANRPVVNLDRKPQYVVKVESVTFIPAFLRGGFHEEQYEVQRIGEFRAETHESAIALRQLLIYHYGTTRSLRAQNNGNVGIDVFIEALEA